MRQLREKTLRLNFSKLIKNNMEKFKENKGGLIVLVALILLTIAFFVFKSPKVEAPVENNEEVTDPLVGPEAGANVYVPMPADADWIPQEVFENKLTLDIPNGYYVSKPRIGDCDVTSISTESNGKPISVAFIYNVGCDNADLKVNAAQSIEKNGYIFRTNYTSPSVVAVFEKIVAGAK